MGGTLSDGTKYSTSTVNGVKLYTITASPKYPSAVGKTLDSANFDKLEAGKSFTYYKAPTGGTSYVAPAVKPVAAPAAPTNALVAPATPTAPAVYAGTPAAGGYSVQSATSAPLNLANNSWTTTTLEDKVHQALAKGDWIGYATATAELMAARASAGTPVTSFDSIAGGGAGNFGQGTIPGGVNASGQVTTPVTPTQMQNNQNNGNPGANLPAAPSATPNQEQIAATDPYPMQGYDPGLNGTSGPGGTAVPPATTPVAAGGAAAGATAGATAATAAQAAALGLTLDQLLMLGGIGSSGLATYLASKTQADAATNAATTQSEAAEKARLLQESQFNTVREDWKPWREAGAAALPELQNFYTNNPDFDMSKFQADPGYSFRLSEGRKALENSAAARGGLLSGNTLKGIQNYGQEAASQEYNNAFNRYNTNRGAKLNHLQSLAGMNQTAIQQTNQAGSNYANNVGSAITNGANATAGGITGAANANASGWMGASNTLTNYLSEYYKNNRQNNYINALNGGEY